MAEIGRRHDVFLSYAPDDAGFAHGAVRFALESAGIHVYDSGQTDPGRPEVEQLAEALEISTYVVVVLSTAYVADRLQRFLTVIATHLTVEDRERRLIPLIYRSVEIPDLLLRVLTSLDCTNPDDWGRQLTRLTETVGKPLRERPGPPPCPYPGMVPFAAEQEDSFFGREDEIDDLVDRFRLQPRQLIIGPSGCGKSSLVFAGAVPALVKRERELGRRWTSLGFRPGAAPCERLHEVLGGSADDPDRTVASILESNAADRLLLVVDQLEELLAGGRSVETGVTAAAVVGGAEPTEGLDGGAADGDPRQQFIRQLAALSEVRRCTVVATMRADFFGELMKHAGLWEQFRDPGARYEVAPLSGPGLERAITKPALDKGVYVEARLVQALVADAGSEPGMMPFLQETLRDLWERMEFRVLPMSGYVLLKEAYGDPPRTRLHRALENHARAAMSGLAPERQEIAKRIMLRLIQLGDGRPDTRRQRTMAELEQVDEDRVAVHEVVEQLSAARLLTSTWSTDGAGVELVDLAHEALIESWDELRSSVKELRRDVRVRERLEDNASEWRRRDRHGGWLDDIELKEAQEWATTAQARRLGIDTGIVELIEASDARIRDQREAAERERDRRLRITRRWLAGAVAAVVAIGIVALVAWDQQQRAQRAADETKAVELATVSSQLADQSLDRALLLAIEANRLSPVPEAESSLVTALARLPALERVLRGHDAEVRAVAVSTEGAVIASAGRDHRIILWDSDGSRRRTIEGHTGEVHGLAFDRTGSILVSSSDDGTVRRWDPGSGAAIGASSVGHVGNVRGVAIDPAGRWFASAGHDATVRVWDLATGDEVTRLDDHRSEALDVAFSADGALLASAGQDGAVIVYRTEDFAEIARFELALPARAIAFNPVVDSQLAIGRQDWLVTVWDALTDDVVAELSGHDDRVFDVAFSPDGAAVASAGRDQKIIIHDVDTGRMLTELAGHSADVRSLAYTASGRLVSGSRDRTVMVWDPDQRPRLVETPHGPSAADGVELHPESGELLSIGVRDAQPTLVSGSGESVHLETLATRPSVIAVSPTGTPVVLGNRDGTISFVDGSSLRETGDPLDAHQAPVTALAVSADGEAAASGDGLGAIAVWDISDGEIVQRAQVAGFAVRDLHFDRARDRLFVSDDSGALWSLDLDGGLELRALADNRVRARHLAVSADGSTLVVGTGQDLVQLWDIDGVEPSVTSVIDHQGEVDAIAVDASGRIAAASAEAGTVTMWELESGRTLGQLPVTMPLSIALSSSPARLAVATPTGALTWTLDIDDMMTAACDVANRDLTPAEWEFYIGGSVDRTCTTA